MKNPIFCEAVAKLFWHEGRAYSNEYFDLLALEMAAREAICAPKIQVNVKKASRLSPQSEFDSLNQGDGIPSPGTD